MDCHALKALVISNGVLNVERIINMLTFVSFIAKAVVLSTSWLPVRVTSQLKSNEVHAHDALRVCSQIKRQKNVSFSFSYVA
jgi:hypothetical protein